MQGGARRGGVGEEPREEGKDSLCTYNACLHKKRPRASSDPLKGGARRLGTWGRRRPGEEPPLTSPCSFSTRSKKCLALL